jgi:hypothetical protein
MRRVLPALLLIASAPAFARPARRPWSIDEVTFRHTVSIDGHVRERNEVTTERLDHLTDWKYTSFAPALRAMAIGERRRLRFAIQNGDVCDHFGCGPKEHWTVDLELLAVTPHHDELPGGLTVEHAGAVVASDGVDRAYLPTEVAATGVDEVRLTAAGDGITVGYFDDGCDFIDRDNHAHPVRHETTIRLDVIRGRLDAAAGLRLAGKGRWREAAEHLERSLAVEPNVREVELGLARARAALGDRGEAERHLGALVLRDPVWLYGAVQGDRRLAPIAQPLVAPLRAAAPGVVDAQWRELRIEPTGRYLARRPDLFFTGDRVVTNAVVVYDRADGHVVTALEYGPATDKTVVDLGFVNVPDEARVEGAGLTLRGGLEVRADGDHLTVTGPGVQTTAPAAPGRLGRGVRLPDVLVYQWHKAWLCGDQATGLGVIPLARRPAP